MDINIPKIYEPLFKPNHTEEQARKFTQKYKSEVKRRILLGEDIDLSELGVKTFILHGGRISGKTKNDELATAPLFFGERGDIWYCRSEQGDIRMSIFQSMQSTLHSLGFTLSDGRRADFRVSKSPFEITCNLTGNKCQFFAINKDINRTKSFEPPSGKLKKVILEEANEPDGKIYVEALKSTVLRFFDENSKIVYRYNPPPSLRHWANIYYPNLARQGATFIHSSWENIIDWLDPAVIAEIVQMRKEDPLHYRYWYEGEPLSEEGRVIWAFKKEKHVISLGALQRRIVKDMFYQPVFMFYGIDSGLKRDATAVSAWALYPNGVLIKLATFYEDIAKFRRVTGEDGLSHSDQAQIIAEWHEKFKKEYASYGITIPSQESERWCFDGAAITQDLMLEFRKLTGYRCVAITNKDIERDIARLNNAYRAGKLWILNVESNEISMQEMETFMRDENQDIPEGQSDHTIDADKYATYDYYYNFL